MSKGTCWRLRQFPDVHWNMSAHMNLKHLPVAGGVTALVAGFLLPPATVAADVLTPLLNRPIYEGARQVLIRSLQEGTEITVWRKGISEPNFSPVGQPATAGREAMVFTLPQGRTLEADDKVRVTAKRTGEGEANSEEVHVGAIGTEALRPDPTTPHVFTKSRCVGAKSYPGATVTVQSPVGLLDRGVVRVDGEATVILEQDHQLNPGDILGLSAAIAGKQSAKHAELPTRHYEPLPWHDKVPPPQILGRPEACDRVVSLMGHQPGADFQISKPQQANGPSERFRKHDPTEPLDTLFGPNCAVRVQGRYLLGRELREGWEVRAKQEFRSGTGVVLLPSVGSDYARVVPTAKPAMPILPPELFVGQTKIGISNLDPSATVVIRLDADDEYKKAEFKDVLPASGPDFAVPPLPRGWVRVRQSKCGKASDWAEAPVKQPAGPPPPPRILTPLYACASILTVVDRKPSAWIEAVVPGGPTLVGSGPHIDVLPHLLSHWSNITARQERGGLWSAPSDPVSVQPVPEALPALELEGAGTMKGTTFVDICSPIAMAKSEINDQPIKRGASLIMYAGDSFVGERPAVTDREEAREIEVPLAATFIQLGTKIEGTQKLCSAESQRSAPLTVKGRLAFANDAAHEIDVSKTRPRDSVIRVKMGCPVWTTTKVTLVSADPAVVEVLQPDTRDIKIGDTGAEFQVRVKKADSAELTVSATHLVDAVSKVRGCDWVKNGSPQTVKFSGAAPPGSTDTVRYFGSSSFIPANERSKFRIESMHNKHGSATLRLISGTTCPALSQDVLLQLGPSEHLAVPTGLRSVRDWTACVTGVDVGNPPPIDVDVYYRKWPCQTQPPPY